MMLIATAEPAYLLSPIPPVLMAIVLVGWAWVIGNLDKDAEYYHLKRFYANLGQLGCGILGFGLMLLIPIFFIGFLVGLIFLAGGILGYAYYRNQQVPESKRWTFNLDSFKQKLADAEFERAQRSATLVLLKSDEGRVPIPSGDSPEAEAHHVLSTMVEYALPRGADRLDILVDSEKAKMAVRVDGVKYAQPAPDPKVALALIDYVKSVADMDVADRRKRQVGEVKFEAEELGRHTFEIVTFGSTRGLSMTLEIDTHMRAEMKLTQLGLLAAQKDQLNQLVEMPGHVVLIAAPPREGGTTTIFSLLNEHDPYVASVMTLEDEAGFELEGVNHTQIPEGSPPAQFNEKLAQMIRTDPQVMMLSRFADADTAKLVAKNAESVRFYVPLPAKDTQAALLAWLKAVGDVKLGARALGAVVAQRLVRKLCMTCKTPYKPDAAALRKLNIPAGKAENFFSASGKVVVKDKPQACPDCQGLGYKGRVGVFELMVLDDAARKLVAAKDFDALRSHLRKQRMLYLQESALAKVVDGTTDIKEITRAIGDGK